MEKWRGFYKLKSWKMNSMTKGDDWKGQVIHSLTRIKDTTFLSLQLYISNECYGSLGRWVNRSWLASNKTWTPSGMNLNDLIHDLISGPIIAQ